MWMRGGMRGWRMRSFEVEEVVVTNGGGGERSLWVGWMGEWVAFAIAISCTNWMGFHNNWRLIMDGGYTRHNQSATRSSVYIIPPLQTGNG